MRTHVWYYSPKQTEYALQTLFGAAADFFFALELVLPPLPPLHLGTVTSLCLRHPSTDRSNMSCTLKEGALDPLEAIIPEATAASYLPDLLSLSTTSMLPCH